MNFVSAPNAPQSHLFTCLTCQVAFHAADSQRNHYRSDWHRYNLKRKVAELPPVTAEAFASKVLAQKNQALEAQASAAVGLACEACRKDFASEGSFNTHMQSKKHKESQAKFELRKAEIETVGEASIKKPASEISEQTEQAEEEDIDEEQKLLNLIDAKIARAVRLTEQDCLFCTHKAEDFESNMVHMTDVHSFFIPDVDYLVDLKGLVKYLGEKLSIANVCLYCNGKGRELKSLESVRNHMESKSHIKIAYDHEMDIMEISDFYDFSSSYTDVEGADPNEELSARPTIGGVELADNELELILPSGARIGHRSMARYYKQTLRPIDEQEERSVRRLLEHSSNKRTVEPQYETRGRRLLLTQGGHDKLSIRQIFKDQKKHEQYKTRVGLNANRLQRHFREQILV